MERFIQEVLVIFIGLTALVVLFYIFTFLFRVLLVAIGVAIIYRIIKWIFSLFSHKKNADAIDHSDL